MMYNIMLVSMMIVMVVYVLFMLMFYKTIMKMELMSSYECGFDIMSSVRYYFSYRFFLLSILFIIFDVEISLMLPIPFYLESELGSWIFFSFIMILLIGLIYEYSYGSLDWLEVS